MIDEAARKVDAAMNWGIFVEKDPVCGLLVDPKKTKFSSIHDGHPFYFCSTSFKKTFDNDPHKYGHAK